MSPFADIDIQTDAFAEFYDELPLWSATFGLLMLDRVPVRAGQTILDVGAGSGFLSIELAQRCGPGTRVIAVDPWAPVARRLRRRLAHLGLDNVEVVERDAVQLDLPDGSVDLIVSNLGINNFENADVVLRNCHRVAKPGARLFLTTNLSGHMREFYDVFRATLIALGQEERLAALDDHIAHRGTFDSVIDRIAAAGFTPQNSVRSGFRMRFADGTALLRHSFIRMGFLPAWKSMFRPESADASLARLEADLNAAARATGSAGGPGELALTIPIACIEGRK
jgi:ubiquinone/menaquinone biosynthesis C-methylase UbiE